MKTVTIHSYRGGTGKTSITLNLAEYLANMGKKICLIDFDLRSPALLSYFGAKPRYYINDYLEERCRDIEDVLVNIDGFNDNLYLAFASPDMKHIKESMKTDRTKQMKILNRILNGRDALKDKMDYLLFDTAPGVRYSSTNAIVSSDFVILILTPDRSDIDGTKRMIDEIHEIIEMPRYLVLNKVPKDIEDNTIKEVESVLNHSVMATIPCDCEIMKLRGVKTVYSTNPSHSFLKAVKTVANQLFL